jgi:hypothetical protein
MWGESWSFWLGGAGITKCGFRQERASCLAQYLTIDIPECPKGRPLREHEGDKSTVFSGGIDGAEARVRYNRIVMEQELIRCGISETGKK